MLTGFWLGLLLKMAITATVVVAASMVAERTGPFVAGVLAATPVSTAPAYAMLAYAHDSAFIAQSALDSFAGNAAAAVFTVTYVTLAPRLPLAPRLACCALAWLAAAAIIHSIAWTVPEAVVLVTVTFAAAIAFMHHVPPGVARARRGRRWYDLPGRALVVGGVVGTVVSVSRAIGPTATGIATVFPINISSMAIVIDLRLGAGMSAATVASAMRAMTGMTFAYLLLHLIVAPLGKWPALLVWLLACITWSGSLLVWRVLRPAAA
ncbi:MAG TPA: hypothetical protein VHY76_13155 [Acetobacteraceae bacterium]|jgi:uncharacterized membrane protein (GlpM family)|nr:hypothetical protein [Acetobacteraceae bacterium]